MKDPENPLDRVDYWIDKFKEQLSHHVKSMSDIHPEMTSEEAKEEWILNKIAVLQVGSEELGKQIRALEAKLNNENT